MKRELTDLDMQFIKFCISELGIETSPKIKIGDDHAVAQEVRAMGYYSPVDNQIWVLRGDRVPADWYRTLAHELVHWRQRELGQEMDGSDGSELENEANSKAGVLLREFGRREAGIYVVGQGETHERVDFYLSYYSNLSPDNFSLSSEGDTIKIRIPQAEHVTPESVEQDRL